MVIFEVKNKVHGNQTVIVDESDYEEVKKFKWYLNPRGNKMYVVSPKAGLLHRFLLNVRDSYFMVDHKNGNTLDNRRENIRVCNSSQNQANRPAFKGKYMGVCWCKVKRKWKAQIKKHGHVFNLGVYVTEEDAAIAYNAAAPVLHGEFAYLNKIP